MRSEPQELNTSPDSDAADLAARWSALRAHPETARWMSAEGASVEDLGDPLGTPTARAPLSSLLAFLVLLSVAMALLVATGTLSLFCPPLMALPLAGLALLALLVFGQLGKPRKTRAPLERYPALVIACEAVLHTESSGHASTCHRVKLRFADGAERTFPTEERARTDLAPNAMGVAFLRAGRVVGFGPVPAETPPVLRKR